MKLLVTTDQWPPDATGGSARVAADTAHALARRGHEVVVLAPSHEGSPPVADEEGVEVRRVIGRGPVPQTLADPVGVALHARALRTHRFDVVLAHQATNAVGLVSVRLGAPLAFVFHASPLLELRFLRRRLRGLRRAPLYGLDPIVNALERTAVAKAGATLVLSRFSEELARSRHPRAADRVRLVGGGVGDAFFVEPGDPTCRARLGIPPGVLLFTARRLEPRMGVEVLIEALALLDEHIVLAVAGHGYAYEELDHLVHELGLAHRVRLLGHVSDEDLRSLYAAADLFVLPTIAYEGFGMSTVEALAAGTPALGTAVGATPEILGQLGPEFTAPDARPAALADSIARVVPLLGPELRARARRLAEQRYRWDEVIVHWEEVLTSLPIR